MRGRSGIRQILLEFDLSVVTHKPSKLRLVLLVKRYVDLRRLKTVFRGLIFTRPMAPNPMTSLVLSTVRYQRQCEIE